MEPIAALIFSLIALLSGFLPDMGRAISYVAPPLQAPAPRIVNVLFGGDMMFDRSIRLASDQKGQDYLLACLDPLLSSADLVVANLEGPITTHVSVSATSTPGSPNNVTFTFPTTTAQLLYRHNIRLVSIGNNHVMNFSLEGLLQTKRFLDEAHVEHFGDPDLDESGRVARLFINGVPLSFVNWSDWTSDKTDHTIDEVRAQKRSGYIVIVYAHWGDEYVPPPERVRQLAHSFVDAGADLVVGSHPHIVQESEQYKGKTIYYSLGNLIFDQYWDESVSHGLMLRVVIDSSGVRGIEEVPVELKKDRQTCPVT